MSLLTNWGYTFTEISELPDLITAAEYNAYTNGKYAGYADQIGVEISAASASVRNFVGWHLGPSESCALQTSMFDRRVIRVGGDLLIQLPARFVTEVESVQVGGVEYERYILDPSGLLRVIGAGHADQYDTVEVQYTAGLPDALIAPVKELIAHRVTHAIAVPPGITSEASGGVSVTYNANWINNSRASALAGDNKEILIPYKVQGVF